MNARVGIEPCVLSFQGLTTKGIRTRQSKVPASIPLVIHYAVAGASTGGEAAEPTGSALAAELHRRKEHDNRIPPAVPLPVDPRSAGSAAIMQLLLPAFADARRSGRRHHRRANDGLACVSALATIAQMQPLKASNPTAPFAALGNAKSWPATRGRVCFFW